jgi:hypothetical protein
MNRMLRTLAVAGALAPAAIVFSACADNESTLFVHGVLHVKPPLCTVLDVSLRRNYEAALLVGNQYAPRGNKQQLRTETTRVVLTGAEVTLTDGATGAVFSCPNQANCGQYSVYGSGFTDSSKGDDPGWGLIFAQLVPNAVGDAIANDTSNPVHTPGTSISLVATIKVFGRSLGGQDIESGNFSFPIEVCSKCLIDFSHTDPLPPNNCVTPTDFTPQAMCQEGQDDVVDCRACTQNPACVTPP